MILANKQYPHLKEAQITSFFTPPESRTLPKPRALQHSDEAIKKELEKRDILVIGGADVA